MPQPSSAYHSVDLYSLSKKLAVCCYELTAGLPTEEKLNLVRYIRSAALSLHVNIAQARLARKKKKRAKLVDTALNAIVVIESSVDVLVEVGLATHDESKELLILSNQLHHRLKALKKQKDSVLLQS